MTDAAPGRPARLPTLRLLLGLAGLVLLLLPLAAVQWLRLYESALVRQTESELLAQGVLLSTLAGALSEEAPPTVMPGPLVPTASAATAKWQPFSPRLDLRRDAIEPPPPPTRKAGRPADPAALAWGRRLAPALRRAQRHLLAGVRLTDARGVVVASTVADAGPMAEGGDLAVFPEIEEALHGYVVRRLRKRSHRLGPNENPALAHEARFRVVVAMPVVAPSSHRVIGAVLLMRTPTTLTQVLKGHGAEIMGTLAFLLAAAAVVGRLALRRVAGPLRAIVRQARHAAGGRLDAVQPLARPGAAELAELSAALALMARRLEARTAYIETFARHVAHEFKTPLAALTAAHEMLADDAEAGAWPAGSRRVLAVASSETDRLRRLTQSLLALARAEHPEPAALHRGATTIGPWAESFVLRWRERGLDITLGFDPGAPRHAMVALSSEGLDAIFDPLADNACTHGGPAVRVALTVGRFTSDGRLSLVLGDTGPGITSGNRAKVFEPFFTTGRDRGGTGLGLAIVLALLRSHGGDIGFNTSHDHYFWHGFYILLPIHPGSR